MVGCEMVPEHTHSKFWQLNPDSKDPRYNTKHGMYEPNCGLDNVLMSYGHDGTFCLRVFVFMRAVRFSSWLVCPRLRASFGPLASLGKVRRDKRSRITPPCALFHAGKGLAFFFSIPLPRMHVSLR